MSSATALLLFVWNLNVYECHIEVFDAETQQTHVLDSHDMHDNESLSAKERNGPGITLRDIKQELIKRNVSDLKRKAFFFGNESIKEGVRLRKQMPSFVDRTLKMEMKEKLAFQAMAARTFSYLKAEPPFEFGFFPLGPALLAVDLKYGIKIEFDYKMESPPSGEWKGRLFILPLHPLSPRQIFITMGWTADGAQDRVAVDVRLYSDGGREDVVRPQRSEFPLSMFEGDGKTHRVYAEISENKAVTIIDQTNRTSEVKRVIPPSRYDVSMQEREVNILVKAHSITISQLKISGYTK